MFYTPEISFLFTLYQLSYPHTQRTIKYNKPTKYTSYRHNKKMT